MTKNEAIKLINKNIQINKISKYSFYICISTNRNSAVFYP